MSDKLLCPFRKKTTSWIDHQSEYETQNISEEEFLPCIKEDCAAFREEGSYNGIKGVCTFLKI